MFIESTPETVAEAKRALEEFVRRGRHTPTLRPETPRQTFSERGKIDTDIVTDANREQIKKEARESAHRYCEARSKNVRPLRQVDESNQAAVEGQLSALDWLKRKGKSRLK
jgi:hypothetical protein